MRLVTIDRSADGRTGAIIGDDILDLGMAADIVPIARWIPPSMIDIILAGEDGLAIVRKVVRAVEQADVSTKTRLRHSGALTPYKTTKLRIPVQPQLIISHGRAYADHNAEMGAEQDRGKTPGGFVKTNGAVIATGEAIVLPPRFPDQIDWEGEISVVFGRDCHNVSRDKAMDCVWGWTILNDVSPRNHIPIVRKTGNLGLIVLAKQAATMAPLGPAITTIDEIPDWRSLHMQTRVNGELMQECWTKDMLWPVPELIEYFSSWYRFQPGDVMTLGTPGGSGVNRDPPIFLKPGDVVTVAVDKIGVLENHVVAAD